MGQQGGGDSVVVAGTTSRGLQRVSAAEVAAARQRWRQRGSGNGSTAEALPQWRCQLGSRAGP